MDRRHRPGLFRSLSSLRLFSMSLDDFRTLPRTRKGSWHWNNSAMGPPKELTSSQHEFYDACKKGDLLKVAAYISAKKSKRPKTPLNLFRPSTPLAGWLAAIRDYSSWFTPLHVAALHGHAAICKLLIEADPSQTTIRDKKENLPLHLAAYEGHNEIVQMLVDATPETVDTVNNTLETPLHLAAHQGNAEVCCILLKMKANGYMRNSRNENALDLATKAGHAAVCRFILGYCQQMQIQCATDSSQTAECSRRQPCVYPVHTAARYGRIPCLRVFREADFDMDFVAKDGSAMHVACLCGQPDSVMFLIESGINPYLRDCQGKTAMESLKDTQEKKDCDITHLLQSRDGWEDCEKLLAQYLQQWEKANINSSSDSGIDGKDYRRQDDRNAIWQKLPTNSRNVQMGCRPGPARSPSTQKSETEMNGLITLPRNWNSDRRALNIPLTSPYYAQKHRSVDRGHSTTLPMKLAPLRTHVSPRRETILPAASSVFSPPAPQPDCSKIERHGASFTYNPTCSYDNVPKEPSPPYDDPFKFNYQSASLGGSMGRAYGRNGFIRDGTQTLPLAPRQRPSLKSTFSPIAEVQNEESRRVPQEPSSLAYNYGGSACEESAEINSGLRSPLVKEDSYGCSTLERSMSPSVVDSDPVGRAPLAQPEEMTGSTTTSILSYNSPERDFRSHSANGASIFTTSITVQASDPGFYNMATVDSLSMDTVNASMSSLSFDGQHNPPSPNTSQRQIFDTLLSQADISAKLNADNRKEIISPSITELSDSTVASSCSLPVISQISTSPPSPLSPKKRLSPKRTGGSDSISSEVRLRSGVSSQMSNSDYQINEQDEWNQIEGIMSSFGGGICRESVFSNTHEKNVSQYLRDTKTHAITLRRSLSTAESKESINKDEANMITWLSSSVGLSRPMAEQIGELLVANGFDKVGQLHGSLTVQWMDYLHIDRQSQGWILAYVATMNDHRPSAEDYDYLSDWLCSVELIFYLSNFMEAGFKSVDHFKRANFAFEDYKNTLKIDLIGHISRLMNSFDEPYTQATGSQRALVTAPMRQSATYTPIQLKLLTEHITFSAHYLGFSEISNINGTEESRGVMALMKRNVRNMCDITQVMIEINVTSINLIENKTKEKISSYALQNIQIVCQDTRDLNYFSLITVDENCYYCHVFSVFTADIATEVIGVLKEAFDLAFGMMKKQESLDSEE